MLDPSMTLFGKKFQVNSDGLVHVQDSPRSVLKESCVEKSKSDDQLHKEITEEESTENEQADVSSEEAMDESTDAPAKSETTDETEKAIDAETNQDEKDSNDPKKQLKKPDKILPCPRCNSMDTKFCYYNNYNINQPRHFCKNCQRYWTAGGTMRSVPVGAGRRKNKSSASRYSHLNLSETVDVSNGTVLTFGSENPLSDRNVLNNDFRGVENCDDRSSGSTVTTASIEDQPKQQQFNGFANQMPCFQWPYMWNPAVPVPFYPSAFPMPIYPHPYWNGAPFPCNVPWAPPQNNSESNPSTPTLGKHTRDGEIISPSDNDRSSQTTSTVLIPKTLRIDDPDEAAKSSIWTTLGIKKDKGDPTRNGFFNNFQSKGDDSEVDASPALFKANPVALCRSFSFQERA